jgi:predicted O-methyltransferase YrrM
VVRDRRYRALASALLSQRGLTVRVCRRGEDVVDVVTREAIDVVVIDASASLTTAALEAARLESLHPPVTVVAVSEDLRPGLAAMPVLPKWTDFAGVFAAIDRARENFLHHGAVSGVR